jgi:hypothetical protein
MKNWLIQLAIKELGPSAIRAAILGILGWLITKSSILSAWGVVSDVSTHTTVIYWDKVSSALIVGLPIILAVVIKFLHRGTADAVAQQAPTATK